MVYISLERLCRNSLVPHIKTPEVPEKTYLPTHLPTWKSLFSFCLISTRAATNKNKPNLKGILLQPRTVLAQYMVVCNTTTCIARRERMKPAAPKNRNIIGLISLVFTGLMLVFECLGFFAFTHPICGDPCIITIMS